MCGQTGSSRGKRAGRQGRQAGRQVGKERGRHAYTSQAGKQAGRRVRRQAKKVQGPSRRQVAAWPSGQARSRVGSQEGREAGRQASGTLPSWAHMPPRPNVGAGNETVSKMRLVFYTKRREPIEIFATKGAKRSEKRLASER